MNVVDNAMSRNIFKSGLPYTSAVEATAKADKFAAKDDRELRAKTKQAILQELNEQLRVKAEKIKLKTKTGLDEGVVYDDSQTGGVGLSDHRFLISSPGPESEMRSDRVITITSPPSRIPVLRLKQPAHVPQSKPTGVKHLARERRRQQRPATYRPGYEWNRGGRLKELRIRNLARKYFYIWMRNAYGRVRPSVVRNHYSRALLQKTFHGWYSVYWTERKEWRLMVRAEYHDRYSTWRKVWLAWKHFVIIQRIKNAKKDIATQHADKKVLGRVIESWRTYVFTRRKKNDLYAIARNKASNALTKSTWLEWRYQLNKKYMQYDVENYALQHWATAMVLKSWKIWREKFNLRYKDKQKEIKAVEFYNGSLVSRCFYKGWIEYIVQRRIEHNERAFADKFYHDKLLAHCLSHWFNRWYRQKLLTERGEMIEEVAKKILARKMWIRWIQYVELCKEKREKHEMADNHCRKRLLKMCFTAIQLFKIQRKLKAMRKAISLQLNHKLQQRRAWNVWLSRCEHNEELRLVPQSRKARNYYRSKILQGCIQQWWQYVRWRRHRQTQYSIADSHYIGKTLPRCIFNWRVYVQLMKEEHEQDEKAIKYRRSILHAKYFYGWLGNYHTSQDYRMIERMAILHYDSELLKRKFMKWKERTNEKLHEMKQEEIAQHHYQKHLCMKSLKDWILYNKELKKSYDHEKCAVKHDYVKKVSRCWLAWQQYVAYRKQKYLKVLTANNHNNQKLLMRVLTAWKFYTKQCTNTKQVVEQKLENYNMQLSRWALWQWYENVKVQIEDKASENKATNHWQISHKAKVFSAWRNYTMSHICNKHSKQQEVTEARETLDKVKVKRVFYAWINTHKTSIRNRELQERADRHWDNKLCQKSFTAWMLYRKYAIRKHLLRKQCMWLHNTRITATFFIKWRQQYHEAQETNTKNTMALWQWAYSVERRCLLAWFSYTLEKKRKAERISQAMDQRRQRFLRKGVSQWLKVATDISANRATYAASEQAKIAYSTMQVVYRCANHWKEWTKQRQQQRGGERKGILLPRRKVADYIPTIMTSESPIRSSVRQPPPAVQQLPHAVHIAQKVMTTNLKSRPKPRKPDFLLESLQKEGLVGDISFDDGNAGAHVDLQTGEIKIDHRQPKFSDESHPRFEPKPFTSTMGKLYHDISSVSGSETSDAMENDVSTINDASSPQRLEIPPKVDSFRDDVETIPSEEPQVIVNVHDKIQPAVLTETPSTGAMETQYPIIPITAINITPPKRVTDANKKMSASPKEKPILLPPSAFTIPLQHDTDIHQPLRQVPEISKEMIRSRESILKEIMDIKVQLEEHKNNTEKIKDLQKQKKQLSDWLEDQLSGVNMSLNLQTDVSQVKEEVNMMQLEINELSRKIAENKDNVRSLADKANSLVAQLQ
ncbi:protein SFI1 homolog [Saccoglossus kowalevskii]|uniref:Protein SFI1 homolog n=1 Tax=Saccoglossus kowalevskii TaxID=10224 RepID=A0ABM0M8U2_SACKO|nr:PREDICTED: protein SFI1 homolog [Saccoglossus kowalevskii]